MKIKYYNIGPLRLKLKVFKCIKCKLELFLSYETKYVICPKCKKKLM